MEITYKAQALFKLGQKPGETPHQAWREVTSMYDDLVSASKIVAEYEQDGLEARIVKITTTTEIVE
jgi:hypothetical protein